MKKRAVSLLLAFALLAVPALAYGGGTGEAVYMNETELAGGFTYRNAVSYGSGGRVETFTVENRPGSAVYPIVMACDTIYGGFTILRMTQYAEALGYNVVGAVNADFGEYTGVPTGMVVENGVYKSSPEGNNAVGFSSGRAHSSAEPEVTLTLRNLESGYEFSTEHLNKSRQGFDAWLFSEHFSTVSTRTSGAGWFVRFELAEGDSLSLDGSVELVVTGVSRDGGSVSIGQGNLVLTAAEAAGLGAVADEFAVGDRVRLTSRCSDAALASCDWVSGCGDILAEGGRMTGEEAWNTSVSGTHPRTALGIKRDGTVVYHVLDGRRGGSVGAELTELAQDMLDMGCETVVNLDGGGSSALSLRMPGGEGLAVVNSPSDGKLRDCASYILFVTDSEPGGAASRLFLREDGEYVLAGSSHALGFAASDGALHAAAVPEGVTASAQRGSVSGGVYSAPAAPGEDTIRLSGGGASGSGTLHVIARPDSLAVSADGAAAGRLVLDALESVTFSVSAEYLGREVLLGEGDVSYTLGGDIGSITPEGVFTAAGQGAQGSIIVECAGLRQEIAVQVAFEFDDMRGHWASDYVKQLYAAGIVNGVSATEYGPNSAMRRGDFVLMLYRAAGEPAVSGRAGFSDVPEDAYFASAVAWAAAEGITQGRGDGSFAPYDTLSRQEGFTFLYRALGALGVQAAAGDATLLDAFPDGDKVSDWARTPTASLIAMGVVSGSGSGLNPYNSLNRAEMAKILALAAA